MTHNMKLRPGPYLMIASGAKVFELRLFDEKRQLIRVGDEIVFESTDEPGSVLRVRVIGLHRFSSFEELYRALPMDKCGYRPGQAASPRDMEAYYPPEKQALYGVLAIEMELI